MVLLFLLLSLNFEIEHEIDKKKRDHRIENEANIIIQLKL